MVLTTPRGWALIVAGAVVGAIFGWFVLALSVVSLPMLVDCDVSAAEAVSASWRASHANKGEMVRWGILVSALLVLGSIPLFVGLAFVLPWLGYSTWHLYTRLIDRDAIAAQAESSRLVRLPEHLLVEEALDRLLDIRLPPLARDMVRLADVEHHVERHGRPAEARQQASMNSRR